MVTSRTLERRRRPVRGANAITSRRRRRSNHTALGLTGGAAERLRLSTFGRMYVTAGLIVCLGIAYLLLATQVTETSYELNRLQAQRSQLLAQQDQLKLQQASLRTPARVDQAASTAGLQHGTAAEYIAYQPVAIDLAAPIGQDAPSDQPGWQRALVAMLNGLGSTRQAAAASG